MIGLIRRPGRSALRLLAVVATSTALAVLPVQAQAAPAPADPSPTTMVIQPSDARETAIYCPYPYLSTGYGPLAQCTQTSGGRARAGFYSPVTGGFSPSTGWRDVVQFGWYERTVTATDGFRGTALGYARLATGYGPVVYATQYRNGTSQARWGNVNLISGLFYPSSGWHATAR